MGQAQQHANRPHPNGEQAGNAHVEDLRAMLDILKSDVQALTQTISEVAKSEGRRAFDTGREKGRDVRDAGEEQYEALRETAEGYGRDAGQYVRETPLTALGIAAGAGSLVGITMRNRRYHYVFKYNLYGWRNLVEHSSSISIYCRWDHLSGGWNCFPDNRGLDGAKRRA